MALANYRLCDVCGKKAFYDANLNYESVEEGMKPFRVAGKEQYIPPIMESGDSLDYLGDWAVICNDCSTKFKTQIVPI